MHQFAPDPTLTDGESLYEAAFGPDERPTDFWDATAQTVIASVLGGGLGRLGDYPLEVLEEVYRVNTIAPLALIQMALPYLEPVEGRIVNITSDAAVEAYEGWGGYGSSKAALEQLTGVLAAEHRIYPSALKLIAEGRVRVIGEKAIVEAPTPVELGLAKPRN